MESITENYCFGNSLKYAHLLDYSRLAFEWVLNYKYHKIETGYSTLETLFWTLIFSLTVIHFYSKKYKIPLEHNKVRGVIYNYPLKFMYVDT